MAVSLRRKPYHIKQRKTVGNTAKSVFRGTKFWLSAAFLATMGMLGYGLLFLPAFEVRGIEVRGVHSLDQESLTATVARSFPRELIMTASTSIITADLKEAEEKVLEEFPSVRRASLQRKLFNTLVLEVEERVPFAVWCQAHEQCFILDPEGVLFKTAQEAEPPRLRIVAQSQERAALNEQVIPEESIMLLAGIVNILSQISQEKELHAIEARVVSESRITITTSEGWHVYINPQENPQWQIDKLKVVLEREIPAGERKALEYIDLRFGDQVYYK